MILSLRETTYVASDYNGDGKTDILLQQNLTAVCTYNSYTPCNYNVDGTPLKTIFALMENISSNSTLFTFNWIPTLSQITGVRRYPISAFSNNLVNNNLEYTIISGNQIRSFKAVRTIERMSCSGRLLMAVV